MPSYEWTAAQLALNESDVPDTSTVPVEAQPSTQAAMAEPSEALPAAPEPPAVPAVAAEEILLPPQLVPPGREPVPPGDRPEMARVDAELLDHMLNTSGEVSIARARLEQQLGSIDFNLGELSRTVTRLKEQLRKLEIETETQIPVSYTHLDVYKRQIQETSKRIKRLGESSQEIGNIVELINDIAEQTNILALNASIQASMAGEAGRGFAVVADEVQRLAERAANATKQIEVLVRTIQTDTNEAVVSMERSTTDVVGGALLAENAGAALEEIEQVSNQIASLVQNISASARQQTSAAQAIARNMQVLKEISAQTADSTSATSSAIAKLAELSAGLRRSASGFRLPGAPAPEPLAPATGSFRTAEEAKLTRGLRPAVGGS